MRASWIAILWCGAFAAFAMAGGRLRAAEPDLRSKLPKRALLPYRIFVPKDYDAKQKYALILFLHGAGERGDDNEAQLKHAQVLRFVSDEVQAKHPCILVAPQCPTSAVWAEIRGVGKKAPPGLRKMRSMVGPLLALLDDIEKQYSIDPDRRYVTGLSMGGFGSFALCLARPDYFAAAMPICGGTDPSRAKEMSKVAFWVFHGGADATVNPDQSRNAVKALKEASATVK
jgi:predicted peptidase